MDNPTVKEMLQYANRIAIYLGAYDDEGKADIDKAISILETQST